MRPSLRQIVERLSAEGLIDASGRELAFSYLDRRSNDQPWYVRTMVGFGAWLASLLLIGFVGGFTFALDGGYAIVGVFFIVAAIFIRRQNDNDFLVQSTLAVSLAGQGLILWGLGEADVIDEPEAFCLVSAIMSSALFFLFPDRIHRVLMILFAAGSVTALFYLRELNALVPLLGPAFTTALIVLYDNQGKLIAKGWAAYLKPLLNGLMLSAFGCLLLSTLYVLPEVGVEVDIYPRPWLSTILLGPLLLWVSSRVWTSLAGETKTLAIAACYALLLLVIGGSYAAPGILLALIVVILGAASGQRSFIGAGIGFLAMFLATYFYGIQVTMLTKSVTLVAAGTAILFARRLILAITSREIRAGRHHE